MARKTQPGTESESKLAVSKVMALKGKSLKTEGSLWLKLGKSKVVVPGTVYILESDGDVFVSFKGISAIYRIDEDQKKLNPHSDLEGAYKKLLKVGRPGKDAKAKGFDIPPEIAADLAALEKKLTSSGLKLGYDPKQGIVKVVKPRAKKDGVSSAG